eukprot:13941469-Ditylum_brightwellii.AAC.1
MKADAEELPLRLLRGVLVNQCTYGFVDASGQGSGSTFMAKDVQGIRYQVGVWGTTTSELSSNFRELQNGVDMLVEEGGAG